MKVDVIDENIPYQLYKICVNRVDQYKGMRGDLVSGLAAQINKDLSKTFPDYKAKVTTWLEINVVWETAASREKPVVIRVTNR